MWDGVARAGPAREFFEEGALIRRSDVRFSVPMIAAMTIYHLHVKVIDRKAGSSAVASAAYRSASRMRDERLDRAMTLRPSAASCIRKSCCQTVHPRSGPTANGSGTTSRPSRFARTPSLPARWSFPFRAR
ncbi:hypothetical protein AGR7C_Lc20026 [Agrobacterium deltaense Zutra 3/1]|uniref:MobA/MobL protein domain-containing protein n=1 Tax=Agrobacterium deltaense Zutra 3/1 TaxID=1183427 RepID=A0A1S7RJQ7_9HYPH|nr:hypothetical protein AGR7C_Lc20026 [Agrobacterium deltaense Zutra 3/1]